MSLDQGIIDVEILINKRKQQQEEQEQEEFVRSKKIKTRPPGYLKATFASSVPLKRHLKERKESCGATKAAKPNKPSLLDAFMTGSQLNSPITHPSQSFQGYVKLRPQD